MKMAKDKSLLLRISDSFTEEVLEEILRKVSGEKEMKVSSWDFGDATAKGDSYLSTVNRVTVVGETAGKVTQVSLVVKSLPKNLARRKTFRSTEMFSNEINFYTKVIPKFTEFLEAKGQANLLSVPKCLAAVVDGENDFLALEDLSVSGYGPVSRHKTLTLEQSTLILKTLAKFHAISFAYKDQKSEEFAGMVNVLKETFYSPELWYWHANFQARLLGIANDALSRECPNSDAHKRFARFTKEEIFGKVADLCTRTTAPTAVISQGDCWAPNYMARDGDLDNAVILDFQLARASSPVLDLSFFIYACTSKDLWDDHYDDLLKIYHDELTTSITKLGSDPAKLYPWVTFMNEVKEQSCYGIIFCFESIPFSTLDPADALNLDDVQGEDAIDLSDAWRLENIKSQEGRRRLADVISFGMKHGYL